MTGVRLGMAPGEVEVIDARVRSAVDRMLSVASTVESVADRSVDPVGWLLGPGSIVIAPFSIASAHFAAAGTRAAASAAGELIARLVGEVQSQRDVSAPSRSFLTSMTASMWAGLLGIAAGGSSSRPAEAWRQVSAVWARLAPVQRAAIVQDFPERIAGLDGVPIVARVEANRVLAARRLADGVSSSAEREFLVSVVRGDTQLMLYEPEHERIIEVVGAVDRPPEHIVTYVPGTGAELADLYDGSTQRVARSLIDGEHAPDLVTLVYLDGPWITWVGERSNTAASFLSDRGAAVAHLSEVVAADPDWSGAKQHIVSHSAGTTVAAYAEVHGARYQTFTSLAGSWLPSEWSAREGSRYLYLQYGIDAIDALALVSSTPFESSVFERTFLVPDDLSSDPAANHSLVASGTDEVKGAIVAHISK